MWRWIQRTGVALCLMMVLAGAVRAAENAQRVKLSTTSGDIILELYPEKAPATVANFLQYVKDGFYDGTVFHRVIRDFMIQGGGMTADLARKPTREPVKNEADNGLRNQRGTVAMARTPDPHSATAQFFINTKDNGFLDFKSQTTKGWGYCVFGKVVDGMAVVDRIESVETTTRGMLRDVPAAPVVIEKAALLP